MADDRRLAEVLIEFARSLAGRPAIQSILDRLVGRVSDVVPVTGAGAVLMGSDLRFVAGSDATVRRVEPLQLDLDEGPGVEAWRTGIRVLIPDLRTDDRFAGFSRPARVAGLRGVFSFPMMVEGHRLGALDVYRREPGTMSAADIAATQVLADVAASYVFNARSHDLARRHAEELRRRTLHDELTGLPNRSLLLDRLAQAVAKAKRSGAVAAVLFVDLDRFKSINDEYGHLAGDATLIAVAERLRHVVRPADTLARLGGDEFVIVCEELQDAAIAETLAERVAEVLALPLRLEGIGVVEVAASVGIAFAGPADLPEVILRDADAAMFTAKRQGGARHAVAAVGPMRVELTLART